METKTDGELVMRTRAGDQSAFDELVHRYRPMAERVARTAIGPIDTAQELAHESLLQAYLSLAHLREPERFGSWLHGIVLNVCRNHLRHQQPDTFSLERLAGGVPQPFVVAPQQVAEEQERQQRMQQLVETLSPTDRTVLRLFYDQQQSVIEIAALLRISENAVKARLHRAREHLRARLSAYYPQDSVSKSKMAKVRRKSKMVPVKVVDVVELDLSGVKSTTVILHDEAGHRTLPIWIGHTEARAIALGLREPPTTLRPQTIQFIKGLLEVSGAELEDTRIVALRDDTFYAVTRIRCGDTVRELDCRPSDAIALAVHTNRPIYMAEEILQEQGQSVPEGATSLGKGVDALMQEWGRTTHAAPPSDPVAIVFGLEESPASIEGE